VAFYPSIVSWPGGVKFCNFAIIKDCQLLLGVKWLTNEDVKYRVNILNGYRENGK